MNERGYQAGSWERNPLQVGDTQTMTEQKAVGGWDANTVGAWLLTVFAKVWMGTSMSTTLFVREKTDTA